MSTVKPEHPDCLSVVIPVYNEEASLAEVVRKLLSLPHLLEVIIVDDCSTDRSAEVARELSKAEPRVRLAQQKKNSGKTAALRLGFSLTQGDIVIVQDADLEYDPAEYPTLLKPIEAGRADVVYGSRFRGSAENRVQFFWHTAGNKILTLISNVVTNLNLTDMATCYKAFHRRVVPELNLISKRFGVDAEFTVKVARGGVRIFEVPVSYFGRSMAEGKKIRLRDGFSALAALARHTLAPRRRPRREP